MHSSPERSEPLRLAARVFSDDAAFDALLPTSMALASRRYWTPLAVARRAAELFDARGVKRVLDVGCGPGKFFLVAAETRRAVTFTGIDHRPHLIDVAQRLATTFDLQNTKFIVSDATRVSWSGYDGFYFFNPFAENEFDENEQLDATVELSSRRCADNVLRVSRMLADAPVGTVLVTYHGFGGPIPSSYDIVSEERAGTEVLRTWEKARVVSEGACFLELAEGVVRVRRHELEAAITRAASPVVRLRRP